jgi:hypothetical protein
MCTLTAILCVWWRNRVRLDVGVERCGRAVLGDMAVFMTNALHEQRSNAARAICTFLIRLFFVCLFARYLFAHVDTLPSLTGTLLSIEPIRAT